MNGSNPQTCSVYELRFYDLFVPGRAYAFPCNAAGQVDMDALSDNARNNYLYARALVGREVSTASVLRLCNSNAEP